MRRIERDLDCIDLAHAPKILGDAVNVPLPIIIVGLFVGAALGGILGAFLITPVIGTVRVVTHYLVTKIERQDPFPRRARRLGLRAVRGLQR